jgi:hypothetical protein
LKQAFTDVKRQRKEDYAYANKNNENKMVVDKK